MRGVAASARRCALVLLMAIPMLLSGFSMIAAAEDLPPTTTISVTGASGLDGWYRSDVLIEFDAVDDSGDVAYTMYKIDDGKWKTYTADVWLTKEGYHTIYYYSVDGAGNVESTKWEIVDGSVADVVISVDGTHTFEYYAIDNAYNSGAIKSVTVKLNLP